MCVQAGRCCMCGVVGARGGDRQNRPRMNASVPHQVSDASRENSRLSRACPRDNEDRRTGVLHRLTLGLVEINQ